MDWIAITADDLPSVIDGDRLEQARRLALAPGQTDPVATAIANAVLHVRGYTRRFVVNGPEGTVPDFLKRTTLLLIAADVLNRIGVGGLTEGVKSPSELAQKRLDGLRPEDFEVAVVEVGPRPSISANRRRFTRESQDGI